MCPLKKMKKHFIVNPAAGRGKHMYSVIEKLRNESDKKPKFSVYATKSVGDAEAYAREISADDREHCFFVCGGDGTVGEVLNGISERDNSVIAIIPAGTGNDFIRNFYSTADEKKCFSDIPAQLEGEEILVDYMDVVINGERRKLSMNVLNAGLDCEVARRVNELRGNKFVPTKLSYYYGLAEQFIIKKGLSVRILADGEEICDGPKTLMSVGNGAYYGGGFKSLANARVDDGLLDLCIIENVTRAQFLGLVGSYKEGKHLDLPKAEELITYRTCKTLHIEFEEEQHVSFDGEIELCKTLDVKVSDRKVRLLLPKGINRELFKRVSDGETEDSEVKEEILV